MTGASFEFLVEIPFPLLVLRHSARPNNSTRGSISMVDMRNRHQPQVPRHSLQQSPWSITGSNVALAPSRDHRCTTVPSPSPATCSDMQYHVLQRSCSTASCRLSIWMPPTVISRWATTSGQYLAHATSNQHSKSLGMKAYRHSEWQQN